MNYKINADMESRRIQRNLTNTQKKEMTSTKEGVLVNNLIKDPKQTDICSQLASKGFENCCLSDICDTLLISENAVMPVKLYEKETKKEKSLIPICAATVGVMGTLTALTAIVAKSTKQGLNLDNAKKLPSLTRNLAVNDETHQALYRMIQSPNKKTLLAGVGVITLTAMAFMGKTFVDGFKDIWIKRKEADIQKKLQENLINVETQSFSGKINIIRSMLSQKAQQFNQELSNVSESDKNVSFNGNKNDSPDTDKSNDKIKRNIAYATLGITSMASIVGLGYLSLKNLRKADSFIKKGIDNVKKSIDELIVTANSRNAKKIGKENLDKMKEIDKVNLENMFFAVEASPDFVADKINKLNWNKLEKKGFLEKILFNMKKSTEKADSAMGGSGKDKPSFYSHVNDYRAFFYNWLIDAKNPHFKNLFFGITGITAASYVGSVAGDGIKDVQVKKYNAQTELDLQKRLVSTELRNFKAKKDSAIQPLCDELYTQKKNGKSVAELKVMADNILMEIKNGPPFVYS